MSASTRPVRGHRAAAAGLTLEFMDEVVEQLVNFSLWYQSSQELDLDRDGMSRAAWELLLKHGAVCSYHVADHLVTACIAMGRYEMLRDARTRQAADTALCDMGFTVHELEQHWH